MASEGGGVVFGFGRRVCGFFGALLLVVLAVGCGSAETLAFGADEFSWESTAESFDGGNEWADEFAGLLYPVLDGLSSPPVSLDERRDPVGISSYFDMEPPLSPEESIARILELDEALQGLGFAGRQFVCRHDTGHFAIGYDHAGFGIVKVKLSADGGFSRVSAFAWQGDDIKLVADVGFSGDYLPRNCLHDEIDG